LTAPGGRRPASFQIRPVEPSAAADSGLPIDRPAPIFPLSAGQADKHIMAVMLSKTYDALVSSGAPEEKARAAAEGLAAYENAIWQD
jgi:hypothetical protein